ncbi:MAG: TetR/AcrR family transcriptional regulator [Acidimicrobiales bacterium]|jgi:AcrR family transcriptional regulator
MGTRPAALQPRQERGIATRRRLLDAALDELLAFGYSRLSASGVAHRAGVTRGAQQHYFPLKEVLVMEAVHHLAERTKEELQARIESAPTGRARVQRAFDAIFEQYSGPLFAAMVELSLASRSEPNLRSIVVEEERAVSHYITDLASVIFEPGALADPTFPQRWATALATIRGIAMLRLLGHPNALIDRQWSFAWAEINRTLLA